MRMALALVLFSQSPCSNACSLIVGCPSCRRGLSLSITSNYSSASRPTSRYIVVPSNPQATPRPHRLPLVDGYRLVPLCLAADTYLVFRPFIHILSSQRCQCSNDTDYRLFQLTKSALRMARDWQQSISQTSLQPVNNYGYENGNLLSLRR